MITKKKAGRGGRRKGAGRKSKWPPETELKTMRLPACLEQEIFKFAQDRIAEIFHQSSTQTDVTQLKQPKEFGSFSSTNGKSALTQVNAKSIKKTIVELSLRVENNSKFIRRKKKVREQIEYWCLSEYNYHKPFKDRGYYELTIPYETEEDLERKIDELCMEMFNIADDDYCFIEFSFQEKGTDRYWH